LARLTGMELDKIRAEYEEIMALIKDLEDILPMNQEDIKSSKTNY
jgi:DNA gyrase/topoisomerase IV subunit A